ncbi:hypothetical protein ACVOCJ_18740, partial [Shigella flexneri]
VTHHAFSSGAGRTSDGNGSHASTLKSPSYTKSVSWQHYRYLGIEDADVTFLCNTVVFDGEELHASYYQSLLSQVRDMVDAL